MLGALTFVPANRSTRELLGLPGHTDLVVPVDHRQLGVRLRHRLRPWLARQHRPEWLFVAIGAFGKLSFVAILAVAWLTGAIPLRGAAGGLWDLVLGLMFVAWLIAHREPLARVRA